MESDCASSREGILTRQLVRDLTRKCFGVNVAIISPRGNDIIGSLAVNGVFLPLRKILFEGTTPMQGFDTRDSLFYNLKNG